MESFERPDSIEAASLESPLSKEQVFKALADFSEEKAAQPDKFSMAFW